MKEGKKIEVKICVGTYSYVMGGDKLMDLGEEFPDRWKELVRITGVIHIDGCHEETMKPPFASVNGKLIEQASIEKLLSVIANEIEMLNNN